jgi:hypothetical protein
MSCLGRVSATLSRSGEWGVLVNIRYRTIVYWIENKGVSMFNERIYYL